MRDDSVGELGLDDLGGREETRGGIDRALRVVELEFRRLQVVGGKIKGKRR